jgi:Response regulator containing a CheY-like receiver domain and an HTH DNA-binding domain
MSETTRLDAVIRIVSVSRNYLLQLGLQRTIEGESHIRVVGQAATRAQAEEILVREKPHGLIIELEAEINLAAFIHHVRAALHTMKIVLLIGIEDMPYAREVCLSGVDGIVLKTQPPAVLLATIDYLCRSPAETIAHEERDVRHLMVTGTPAIPCNMVPSMLKWPDNLTEREHEVIVLIGQGLSNKDIAGGLHISTTTVRHHLTSIFDKLGVTSRQKLLILAHQRGLVELKTTV